jgi:hypothetical protein
MIYYQFDNIFLFITTKMSRLGTGFGRICNRNWHPDPGSEIQGNKFKDPDSKEIIKDPKQWSLQDIFLFCRQETQ